MLTQTAVVAYMAILAQANAVEPQPVSGASVVEYLLQYGPLGFMVLGFITGWIVPGYHPKQLLEENKRLTALFEGKLLPMIETNGTTLDRATQAMEKNSASTERLSSALEALTRDRDRT